MQWKDEDGIVVIYQTNQDIMCQHNKLDNFPESYSNREEGKVFIRDMM